MAIYPSDDRHSRNQPPVDRPRAVHPAIVGWQACRLESAEGTRLITTVLIPNMVTWPAVLVWRGATWIYVGPCLVKGPQHGRPVYRFATSYVVLPTQAEIESLLLGTER